MNNYSIEETRKNMIELMDDFYWNYNNTALNKIIEGPLHKNKYIQELFKNTNGRIILDLVLSEKEKTEKLMTYLMNNFSSYKQVQVIDSLMIELKENFEELEDTELTQYEVVHNGVKTILGQFYNSLESMFTYTPDLLNSKGQLLDGPFKGQKITKFINNWFDYVFTINQNIFMRYADDGMFKSVTNFIVKYIKNKVLGQINFSEVIGKSNNLLILSIKPEDFFTMSLG